MKLSIDLGGAKIEIIAGRPATAGDTAASRPFFPGRGCREIASVSAVKSSTPRPSWRNRFGDSSGVRGAAWLWE